MDDMQEIMEDFLIEAFEMVEQLDQDLVELENNPEDLDLLNRIFRVAHTIKGSSSFLNFDVLTHLTHNMEDVLNKARRGELKITSDIMDVILESIDLMKALLNVIRDNGTDADSGIDVGDCVKRLQAISKGESIDEALSETEDIKKAKEDSDVSKEDNSNINEAEETQKTDSTSDTTEEPDYSNMSPEEIEAEIARLLAKRQEEDKKRRAEKKKEETQQTTQKSTPSTPEEKEKSTAHNPPKASQKTVDGGQKAPSVAVEPTVRVDVKRLDHLMNLIGELVLEHLRKIDEVAYVRFASVYRQFADVESFMEELKRLRERK